MALSLTGLQQIAGRHGNQFIHDTVDMSAPLVRENGGMKREKASGVVMINPRPNGMAGGPISDGGNYPTTTSMDYNQLVALRKIYTAKVKVPIGAAEQVSAASDAVNLVKDLYEKTFENVSRTLDRQIMDVTASLVTTGNTISGGSVSIVADDLTAYREGQQFLWNEVGTGINPNPFTVTDIVPDSTGCGGTVTFSTAATGTIAANDIMLTYGGDTTGVPVTSLWDLSGSGDVYTQNGAIPGWRGEQKNQNGAYTTASLNQLFAALGGRGGRPDVIVMSPLAHAKHVDVAVSAGRRYTGTDFDPYGSQDKATIGGARVIQNPNAPNKKVIAFRSDKTKLGVFKDFTQLSNSGKLFDVAEDDYNYLIRCHGHFEVLCRDRKSVGVVYGLTY